MMAAKKKITKKTGKAISADLAKKKAEEEFLRYEDQRRLREATEPTSDFDRMVEEVKTLPTGKQKDNEAPHE